jgi:serine/threonine protein kinase
MTHDDPSPTMPAESDSSSAVSPSPPSAEVGFPFGRYRLLDKIGSGEMADIFRALALGAEGFERVVAIKRIREEVSQVADIGKLFADEARLSALLDHPNIVQVYDYGTVEDCHYIAMEHLRGKNLDQVLAALRRRDERLPAPLAVFIAREVARGLSYAHGLRDERGQRLEIVHRDVSPANIMLLHAGAVKLLDFGIARVSSRLRLATTGARAGSLRGQCPYLSPEQITGDPVDGRSDVFALGAVLWEMLTGRQLFDGSSEFAIMSAVIKEEIVAPSQLVPGLPEALDRVVLTALARDPDDRYPTAGMMAADLETVMRTLPCRHGDLPAFLTRIGDSRSAPATPGVRSVPTRPPSGDAFARIRGELTDPSDKPNTMSRPVLAVVAAAALAFLLIGVSPTRAPEAPAGAPPALATLVPPAATPPVGSSGNPGRVPAPSGDGRSAAPALPRVAPAALAAVAPEAPREIAPAPKVTRRSVHDRKATARGKRSPRRQRYTEVVDPFVK